MRYTALLPQETNRNHFMSANNLATNLFAWTAVGHRAMAVFPASSMGLQMVLRRLVMQSLITAHESQTTFYGSRNLR